MGSEYKNTKWMEVLRLTFIVVPKQKERRGKKRFLLSTRVEAQSALAAATVKYFLRRFKEVFLLIHAAAPLLNKY